MTICTKMKVIQDGAAILHNGRSSGGIHYLYTEGLHTCIAVLIKGSKGIALLHDSGKLTKSSMAHVFSEIGEIQFWTTAFYPHADQEYLDKEIYNEKYGQQGIYRTKLARIQSVMARVMGVDYLSKYQRSDNGFYYAAEQKWIGMDCMGKICTQKDELVSIQDYNVPNLKLRQATNNLNNACMEEDEYFDCHLQYDGKSFTAPPALVYEVDRIRQDATGDWLIQKMFLEYIVATYTTVKDEYGISLDCALRRAAFKGAIQHIAFLVDQLGIDVNSPGPESGKTALDIAVEKGHAQAIRFLKLRGAK